MFEKLRESFRSFSEKLKRGISEKEISERDLEDPLEELELVLIQNDVAIPVIEKIKERIKEKLLGKSVKRKEIDEKVRSAIREVLLEVLEPSRGYDMLKVISEGERPFVILFLGVNGSGKTTTIAKLCKKLKDMGLSPVIAASDTFRAGAIEQIEEHAKKVGVKVISQGYGADPAAVAYDAIQHAKAKKKDVVLIDTAGRMQTNVNLMEEMRKIKRVSNPHLTVFVGDALTGNDAINQAREFHQKVGFDAVILTKMDADAKGGAAITISYETKKPIAFIGTGQGYDDLKKFDPEEFISRILP